MLKALLILVTLLLAFQEITSFLPRAPRGHGRVANNVSPSYSLLEKDKGISVSDSSQIDRNPMVSVREEWKHRFVEVLDVNGDGKIDHKDAGAVVALAFVSWSLMAAPVMAKSSSRSSSSSRTSSSSRSYSRPPSRNYSTSRSSSLSTRSSPTYRNSSRSPSSPSTTRSPSLSSSTGRRSASRSSSPSYSPSSSSTIGRSKPRATSSSPSTNSNKSRASTSSSTSPSPKRNPKTRTSLNSRSSISNKSQMVGEHVSKLSPNTSSARLQVPLNRSTSNRLRQNRSTPSSAMIVTQTTTNKLSSTHPLSSKISVSAGSIKEATGKSSKSLENLSLKPSTASGNPIRSSTRSTLKSNTMKETHPSSVQENLSAAETKSTSAPSPKKVSKLSIDETSKISSSSKQFNTAMKGTKSSSMEAVTSAKKVGFATASSPNKISKSSIDQPFTGSSMNTKTFQTKTKNTGSSSLSPAGKGSVDSVGRSRGSMITSPSISKMNPDASPAPNLQERVAAKKKERTSKSSFPIAPASSILSGDKKISTKKDRTNTITPPSISPVASRATNQKSKTSFQRDTIKKGTSLSTPSPIKSSRSTLIPNQRGPKETTNSPSKSVKNIPVTSSDAKAERKRATTQESKASFQKDIRKKRTSLQTPTIVPPVKSSRSTLIPNQRLPKKTTNSLSKSVETKFVTSSDSEAERTSKSPRRRSGNRIGGRAKPSPARETRQATIPPVSTRPDRVTVRNNYIINEPSALSYGDRAIVRDNFIIMDRPPANYNTGYFQNDKASDYYFPPQNIGSFYYYDDYAPPLKKGQHYPSYRRPNAPSNPKRQLPSSACSSDLPVKNERIDVLLDPHRGIYVQGSVKSVDGSRCDFVVTYLSPDGSPVQKSFFALPENSEIFF